MSFFIYIELFPMETRGLLNKIALSVCDILIKQACPRHFIKRMLSTSTWSWSNTPEEQQGNLQISDAWLRNCSTLDDGYGRASTMQIRMKWETLGEASRRLPRRWRTSSMRVVAVRVRRAAQLRRHGSGRPVVLHGFWRLGLALPAA